MLQFSFYNSFIKFILKQYERKQDVSKNMPLCHFLLIVMVIAIMLIYKEFFKNTKMRKMLLRIDVVKLLIFGLFSKVMRYTDVSN